MKSKQSIPNPVLHLLKNRTSLKFLSINKKMIRIYPRRLKGRGGLKLNWTSEAKEIWYGMDWPGLAGFMKPEARR